MPQASYPYEHIQLEKDGHVAWLRFNRVTKANAMNYAHLWEVEHAALSLRDEADIRVVIITGNGPHFCSGAARCSYKGKPQPAAGPRARELDFAFARATFMHRLS